MVFSSPVYLFCFFPCLFLLSRILPSRRGKEALLAAAGLVFYAFGELRYVPLLLFTALLHYALGRRMPRSGHKKALCALGVLFDLFLLGRFKYAAFLCGAVNALLGTSLSVVSRSQPAGLSFFTFLAISYLADVYRGDDPGAEDFLSFLLYLSFFPRLLSGPLVRHRDHAAQLAQLRFTREDAAAGLRRFTLGLGKKLLLADMLGSVADRVLAPGAAELTAPLAWLGAVAYTLQLYFDFSGYSDMAIGMGRLFGFRFPENFDRPYVSASLTEFWRRWHITLSGWFRDYVYIPLGGNRDGRGRTALHKICVFLLTGLWHGAGWNFVLWGLWHGLFMMAESGGRDFLERLRRTRPGRAALHIYTLLVVTVGFVLFRAATLSEALGILGAMFRFDFTLRPAAALLLRQVLDGAHAAALAAGAVLALCPRPPEPETARQELLFDLGTLLLFLLALLALAGGSFTPFIYFQF